LDYARKSIWVAAALIIGLIAAEGLYRGYLCYGVTHKTSVAASVLDAWSSAPVVYSRDYGFDQPTSKELMIAHVENGRFSGCSEVTFNRWGNVSANVPDYDAAEVKVLVFGEAITNTYSSGLAWTDEFQELLRERLHKSVAVINFARSGYGALQMFDMASVKVPELKPDFVVFALTTSALVQARHWWFEAEVGGFKALVRSPVPADKADPRMYAYSEALIVNGDVTGSRCTERTSGPVIEKTIRQQNELQRLNLESYSISAILASPRSLIFDRLVHRNALSSVAQYRPDYLTRAGYRALQSASYADDAALRKAIAALKAQRIPIALLHLPIPSEMERGEIDFDAEPNSRALLESLESLTGEKVRSLLSVVALPIVKRSELVQNDQSPSEAGLEFIAANALKVLAKDIEAAAQAKAPH
jgi:hypothetical protein